MIETRGDLDLGQKSLGAEHGGELGPEHLERDLAVVLDVAREVDRGHAAGAELALDAVAVGECGGEARDRARGIGQLTPTLPCTDASSLAES